ncbi:hypothetical protein QUF72_06625 [Desulfobacterales bacterium HSG2]|nr:hypothetical protein [Desulfobacterales bacterium HSG2]
MCSRGWPGNLGEPSVSLRREKGTRRRSGRKAKSRHYKGSPAFEMSLRKRRHKRQKTGQAGYPGRTEKIERPGDGQTAVLAEHSTDGRNFGKLSYRTDRPGRRGSDAQATRRREGGAGHDDPTGGTQRPQTV